MNAEAGMVKIHAHTMLPATPQRTVEMLRVEPTPTIAPVMVCVVETGMPMAVARKSVMAPPVSAQKASAVRWGVAGNIVWAWIFTIPASAFVAGIFYWLSLSLFA